jgi:hypothetical protein
VRGQWDFSRLDKDVAAAVSHGVEVGLTLGSTPHWASARPDEHCKYGGLGGCAAEPANIADWENYVRTVVQRYRGRIKYYEIWNEPDFSGTTGNSYFSGTADKMQQLASTAYAIIQQADSGARVLSPAPIAEASRIEPFLNVDGKTFDVFAAHYYVLFPEELVSRVNTMKALLTKYGLQDKPVWNTESGYMITTDPNAPPVTVVSGTGKGVFGFTLDHKTAAALIARQLILGASAGLGRSALYAWDDDQMGFVNLATYEPTAVGKAYGVVAGWLIGSQMQVCVARSTEFWQCEIARNGRRAWLVWNTSGNMALQQSLLPAAIVQTEALDGSSSPTDSTAPINVGIAPILLKTDTQPW